MVGGFDLIVSRTGYTGEKMAFELFVHPERAVDFWNAVLKAGEPFGVKPIGLGARDSLRTEAGLPLYGHEMGARLRQDRPAATWAWPKAASAPTSSSTSPGSSGARPTWPASRTRKGVVVRFRFDEKGVRMAHNGDPVVDKRRQGHRLGDLLRRRRGRHS